MDKVVEVIGDVFVVSVFGTAICVYSKWWVFGATVVLQLASRYRIQPVTMFGIAYMTAAFIGAVDFVRKEHRKHGDE